MIERENTRKICVFLFSGKREVHTLSPDSYTYTKLALLLNNRCCKQSFTYRTLRFARGVYIFFIHFQILLMTADDCRTLEKTIDYCYVSNDVVRTKIQKSISRVCSSSNIAIRSPCMRSMIVYFNKR